MAIKRTKHETRTSFQNRANTDGDLGIDTPEQIKQLAEDKLKATKAEQMKPPAWLAKEDYATFKDLCGKIARSSILVQDHADLIAQCAQLLNQMGMLNAFIRKNGLSYEVRNRMGGMLNRVRPEQQALANIEKRVHALLTEFGLSPLQAAKHELRIQRARAAGKAASAGQSRTSGKFAKFKKA